MERQNTLKCLLVQSQLFWADPQANRDQLENIMNKNATGCDLVVFPETFTSGFLGDADVEPETMQGPTVGWMQGLAAEFDCVICGSAAIATGRGNANRFLWVTAAGEVSFYDKRHLFSFGGEDQRYVAGDERKIFPYRGWRVCPQICYDLRFPVWCRNRGDYDLMLFVANWPEPRTSAWSALLRARAIENQCYVIGVNRSGNDPRGQIYSGASGVYDPLGEMVLDLGADEGTGSVEIALGTVKAARERLPFQQDADDFDLKI